ncbi:5'-nucleotidase C-terminal domain-containing protein [Bacillus sp. FSL W7-1360]
MLAMILKKIFVVFLGWIIITVPKPTPPVDPTPEQPPSLEGDVTLDIIHTNDIHSALTDFGKVSAYIKSERAAADHFLYLDAGDFVSGDPIVDLNHGKPMIDIFNLVGLDAVAIGNHEFDYGPTYLQENMEASSFPWLGANIDTGDTGVPNPDPYVILDVNGLSVGVLGLTEAPPSTAPDNVEGMTLEEDYVATALAYQEELEANADVIVALTHIGHPNDRKLAEEVDYFDVIIGGHSHTPLQKPVVINGTPITQAGSSLQQLGKLSLTYNADTDKVTAVDGQLVPVSSFTEVDTEVQAVIDHYTDEMEDILGEVVGHSHTGLPRDGRTHRDAPLGNFWTDAMKDLAGADIALTNNGGLRDGIASGPVTMRDIYKVEPFANQIMSIEMTGQALKDVLQFSYTRNGRNQIDLQTSGLHYEIVTGMTGNFLDVNMTLNGEPVDLEQTYNVAVADYIGTGGSGYNFVGTVLERNVGLMTTAMKEYGLKLTAEGKALDYTSEGRIKISVDPSGPLPGEIIGSTETGLYSANKNKHDVGIGNLYTDAMRAKVNSDIAILNGSSITGEIPPGPITDQQIEALDRFGNKIVVVEATGSELKEMILSQSRHHNGVDLQVSGLTYTLVPGDNKFSDVKIFLADGTPLDMDTTYTVAYNDYMHGASFYQIGTLVNDNLGPVWQAVVDFVTESEGPMNTTEGSRITIEGEDGSPSDPSGTLTVAEAIQQQSGVKPVKGYIVGSIVNSQPVIGEGTHAPSNLLLADDPAETDRAKMLPVQLVNGTPVRTGLNLASHPEHFGKYVRITGSLETYFSTPGMCNSSDYAFLDAPETPAPAKH